MSDDGGGRGEEEGAAPSWVYHRGQVEHAARKLGLYKVSMEENAVFAPPTPPPPLIPPRLSRTMCRSNQNKMNEQRVSLWGNAKLRAVLFLFLTVPKEQK